MILIYEIRGGHSEEDPPVPIPNTEVKLFSADGTARETVRESRSPPILFTKPLPGIPVRAFFVPGFLGNREIESTLTPEMNLTVVVGTSEGIGGCPRFS